MVADTPFEGELALPPLAGVVVGALGGLALCVCWKNALVGAVFGWLYALCQNRTRPLGFLLVGIFFGLNIWILGKLAGGWFLGQTGPLAQYSPFLRSVAFGEIVAVTAMFVTLLRKQPSTAIAKD